MSRKYVIIDADEVGDVDFSEVFETSASTLRYNVAEDEVLLKFEGAAPSFLEGKTQYTYAQILTILAGSAWSEPQP